MNRINEKDCIKAIAFDSNGKIITSLYDSGFRNISSVIHTLACKGSGFLKTMKEISIHNMDRETYGRYNKYGQKIS